METVKQNQFENEFRKQWKTLWRERIDDKVRAEGIANRDYPLLFIDSGTVIIATRKFKPPDFLEILRQHQSLYEAETMQPNPSTGGWGKFIRTSLHQARKKRTNPMDARAQLREQPTQYKNQQLKKGGRGWLHFKM